MAYVKFLSLDGEELTVGGARFSSSETINASNVETASGRQKRFFSRNKKSLQVQYNYIPSGDSHAFDSRKARDYIYSLATKSPPKILVNYRDDPNGVDVEFYGFIDSYSETILRRDPVAQCIYYDLSFNIEEA